MNRSRGSALKKRRFPIWRQSSTPVPMRVVIRILPTDVPEVSDELVKLRERYEQRFRSLFAELPLSRGRDVSLARLLLLGAMNWTPVWYRCSGRKDMPSIGGASCLLRFARCSTRINREARDERRKPPRPAGPRARHKDRA